MDYPEHGIVTRDDGVQLYIREFTIAWEERNEEDGVFRAGGYGLTWDERADIGGWYLEQFERGAFSGDGVLSDVRFLIGHDHRSLPLARSPITMQLSEDKVGLRFDVQLDMESPLARSLASAIRRGDIDKVSIGFSMREEGAKAESEVIEHDGDEVELWTIKRVGDLWELSAVIWPAYRTSSLEPRAEGPDGGGERDNVEDVVVDGIDAISYIENQASAAMVRLRLLQTQDLEA